jgi:hypothetical protein
MFFIDLLSRWRCCIASAAFQTSSSVVDWKVTASIGSTDCFNFMKATLTDANVSEVAIAMGSLLSPISGTLSLVVGIVSQRYLDQSYQVMALRLLIPGMDSSDIWKFK